MWGNKILERFGPRIGLTHEKLHKYYKAFARSGFWTTLLGRITTYIRIYTSMGAGLSLLKPQKFFSALVISSVLWLMSFSLLGFMFRKKWQTALKFFEQHSLVFTIMVLIIIGFSIYRRLKNNKK